MTITVCHCGRQIVKMPHYWWHYDEAANEDHEAEPREEVCAA